jgi:hypothetical protein
MLDISKQRIKSLRRHGLVDSSPIHVCVGHVILNNEAVLGRTARERSRFNGQSTGFSEHPFTSQESLKDEFRGGKVPMGSAHAFQSDGVEARVERCVTNVFHV